MSHLPCPQEPGLRAVNRCCPGSKQHEFSQIQLPGLEHALEAGGQQTCFLGGYIPPIAEARNFGQSEGEPT